LLEALDRRRFRLRVSAEQLHRDMATGPHVLRSEHLSHAPSTEGVENAVPVRNDGSRFEIQTSASLLDYPPLLRARVAIISSPSVNEVGSELSRPASRAGLEPPLNERAASRSANRGSQRPCRGLLDRARRSRKKENPRRGEARDRRPKEHVGDQVRGRHVR